MPEIKQEIVTTPEGLSVCCDYLAARTHFGFDTEFVGEDSYHPRLCLVQVATDDCLFLALSIPSRAVVLIDALLEARRRSGPARWSCMRVRRKSACAGSGLAVLLAIYSICRSHPV